MSQAQIEYYQSLQIRADHATLVLYVSFDMDY
jgi:hypothetical protein